MTLNRRTAGVCALALVALAETASAAAWWRVSGAREPDRIMPKIISASLAPGASDSSMVFHHDNCVGRVFVCGAKGVYIEVRAHLQPDTSFAYVFGGFQSERDMVVIPLTEYQWVSVKATNRTSVSKHVGVDVAEWCY